MQAFKILLLDDEPSVLNALRLLLQALGYTVESFPDPILALDFLRKDSSCSMFLCDFRMPKMDGMAVLGESKKIRPELPFILMSAHAADEEIAAAKERGAWGFLAKPFTPDQLHAVVSAVRESRQA